MTTAARWIWIWERLPTLDGNVLSSPSAQSEDLPTSATRLTATAHLTLGKTLLILGKMRRGSEPLEGLIKDSGNHILVEGCTKRKF